MLQVRFITPKLAKLALLGCGAMLVAMLKRWLPRLLTHRLRASVQAAHGAEVVGEKRDTAISLTTALRVLAERFAPKQAQALWLGARLVGRWSALRRRDRAGRLYALERTLLDATDASLAFPGPWRLTALPLALMARQLRQTRHDEDFAWHSFAEELEPLR